MLISSPCKSASGSNFVQLLGWVPCCMSVSGLQALTCLCFSLLLSLDPPPSVSSCLNCLCLYCLSICSCFSEYLLFCLSLCLSLVLFLSLSLCLCPCLSFSIFPLSSPLACSVLTYLHCSISVSHFWSLRPFSHFLSHSLSASISLPSDFPCPLLSFQSCSLPEAQFVSLRLFLLVSTALLVTSSLPFSVCLLIFPLFHSPIFPHRQMSLLGNSASNPRDLGF